MPRYKSPIKKKGPLKAWHPWLRIGIIIASVLVFIVLATIVVKRIVRNVPPVYGAPVADEFLSKSALISKLTALQTTVHSYDAEMTTVAELQNENATLKAELGRTPAPTGILADVLSLPNRSFYDTIVIDAGSAEGVKEKMVASAFGSVVLGDVTSVTDHTATITLYSQPGRQSTGTAVGSNVEVTLIGRGSGEYEVQLPRDVPLNVGAEIAAQSITPETVATIEKVITDPRDPFQRLLAKAPVNLQALKWVIVR